jgi:hypothetical protein
MSNELLKSRRGHSKSNLGLVDEEVYESPSETLELRPSKHKVGVTVRWPRSSVTLTTRQGSRNHHILQGGGGGGR